MIADVFTFARARMRVLGFTEWLGGFNRDVPKTQLNTRFHLELGQPTNAGNDQDNFSIEVPFTVRTFVAPAKNTPPLIDQMIARGDTIIADFVKVLNRQTVAGIKNVQFNTMTVEPLDESNDNGVILQLNFSALVVVSTR